MYPVRLSVFKTKLPFPLRPDLSIFGLVIFGSEPMPVRFSYGLFMALSAEISLPLLVPILLKMGSKLLLSLISYLPANPVAFIDERF